jgi:alkylation response protein AidB-like acyl-CoA dehydrogenase
MDFRFTEEQTALRDLAREILENELGVERLKAVEASGDWFDRDAWARLAEANLLGLAVSEEHGGMGMGFLELCLLLHEVGRAVAPVPALPALVLGALPLARFGDEVQQKEWLGRLASGEVVLSGAFEPGVPVVARADDGGFVLEGVRPQVPAAHVAQRILVPARTLEDNAVFLVDPRADNVSLVRSRTSRHEPLFELTLAGVRIDANAALHGDRIVDWVTQRALVAIAATQLGVCERALEITTGYLKEREQFGAPLGALAPVQHRCADAYIALDSLRWVTWQAAWKLAVEREAARDARVAKFWAADAGSKITTATQHLHGGMGVDLDYPIHRYFLWAKALELAFGGATPQLLALGGDMARTGPQDMA